MAKTHKHTRGKHSKTSKKSLKTSKKSLKLYSKKRRYRTSGRHMKGGDNDPAVLKYLTEIVSGKITLLANQATKLLNNDTPLLFVKSTNYPPELSSDSDGIPPNFMVSLTDESSNKYFINFYWDNKKINSYSIECQTQNGRQCPELNITVDPSPSYVSMFNIF